MFEKLFELAHVFGFFRHGVTFFGLSGLNIGALLFLHRMRSLFLGHFRTWCGGIGILRNFCNLFHLKNSPYETLNVLL